ncbi:MAG: HEPN domain-containing protein [Deltaproteobacteria bacterium]|nr:HEPN domain-containing protein [Deltaproteobacteria bacterium]
MTLKLHKDCKKRLKQKLEQQLVTIDVTNNQFIDRKSTNGFITAEEALPKHGHVKDQLESFIGEWPFYDFLYGFLSKELRDQQAYDSSVTVGKLTELESYSDIQATSERLVELFDSLPWDYKFTIEFNSCLSPIFTKGINQYKLSDTLSLVKADDQFIAEHPLKSGVEGIGSGLISAMLYPTSRTEWNKDSVYLQFSTNGFVGKYISTQTNENILSKFKAFCGLSIALRLLIVERSYYPAPPKMNFYIHRNINKKWVVDETIEVDEVISETINDLAFNSCNGSLDNDTKKMAWMVSRLAKLKKVFENEEQSEKIILAGQWFFDSYTGKNELLSFVQTMIALEIILGENKASDGTGLGDLLRNRCAYLIGETHSQREDILEDFKKIYDIRSKIVHRGKSKLTSHERVLFSKLQWICRRVILKETELITENA